MKRIILDGNKNYYNANLHSYSAQICFESLNKARMEYIKDFGYYYGIQ